MSVILTIEDTGSVGVLGVEGKRSFDKVTILVAGENQHKGARITRLVHIWHRGQYRQTNIGERI